LREVFVCKRQFFAAVKIANIFLLSKSPKTRQNFATNSQIRQNFATVKIAKNSDHTSIAQSNQNDTIDSSHYSVLRSAIFQAYFCHT
jgi:hypothetical protein